MRVGLNGQQKSAPPVPTPLPINFKTFPLILPHVYVLKTSNAGNNKVWRQFSRSKLVKPQRLFLLIPVSLRFDFIVK